MFPVAIDDFSVSGDLLTQRVNALMTLMGFSRYQYDNEDDEHLSDHVYDDLASSVFHLFADIKRKLVGKDGIYTLNTGIWRNGEGWGSKRQGAPKPEMYDLLYCNTEPIAGKGSYN